MIKIDIKDLSYAQLVSWIEDRGIEPYRADQIQRWIYTGQADDFAQMTNLDKRLRQDLSDAFYIKRLKKIDSIESSDLSRKYIFELSDRAVIESVLIPEKERYTLCISSQAGCAQACRFCLTGKRGFKRNLTKGEIIAQVRDIMQEVRDKRVSNIVLMGMGEPLANYKNVVQAISVITDVDKGLQFSGRRVTLSTAGLADRLPDLGRDTSINLAVSINAADDETRDHIMPINRKYPIKILIEACRRYPLKNRGRITFEYILIKGINDSTKDATRLAGLLRGMRAKINLIPFNKYEGSDFDRPDDSVVFDFQKILLDNHYTVIIRKSKGSDISAACGQLGLGVG